MKAGRSLGYNAPQAHTEARARSAGARRTECRSALGWRGPAEMVTWSDSAAEEREPFEKLKGRTVPAKGEPRNLDRAETGQAGSEIGRYEIHVEATVGQVFSTYKLPSADTSR